MWCAPVRAMRAHCVHVMCVRLSIATDNLSLFFSMFARPFGLTRWHTINCARRQRRRRILELHYSTSQHDGTTWHPYRTHTKHTDTRRTQPKVTQILDAYIHVVFALHDSAAESRHHELSEQLRSCVCTYLWMHLSMRSFYIFFCHATRQWSHTRDAVGGWLIFANGDRMQRRERHVCELINDWRRHWIYLFDDLKVKFTFRKICNYFYIIYIDQHQ